MFFHRHQWMAFAICFLPITCYATDVASGDMYGYIGDFYLSDFKSQPNASVNLYGAPEGGLGRASASASGGVAKVYASAEVSRVPGVYIFGVSASAGFGDSVVFDVAGHKGEAAQFTLSVYTSLLTAAETLDGYSDAYADNVANLVLYANGASLGYTEATEVRGASRSTSKYYTLSDGSTVAAQGLPAVLQLTGSFIIGLPMSFSFDFEADTQVIGAATSMVDFSHSAHWGGFTVSQQGQAIDDYSLTSSSGFDWRNAVTPVPEPSSGFLLAAGLLGLAPLVRRLRS